MKYSFCETYYCMVALEMAVVAGRYIKLARHASIDERINLFVGLRSAMIQFECHMNRHYDVASIECVEAKQGDCIV